MSTNGSSKPDNNVSRYKIHFDSTSIVNSPAFQNMVNSVNAVNKAALENSNMMAVVERQLEPARRMLKLATAVDAAPMLKAFESTFRIAQDQSRVLVNLKGIQDAIKAVSPESLGLSPGWNDILATVSSPNFDASVIETLLAQTDELEEEVEGVHGEQSVQEFFESQPELADEIEELATVRSIPNDADRKKLVYLIQVGILLVASALFLQVSNSSPEAGAALSATGVGGIGIAAVSGKPVRKLIDKLADDEGFTGEIGYPCWEE